MAGDRRYCGGVGGETYGLATPYHGGYNVRSYLIVSAIASLMGFATLGIAGAEVALVFVFWWFLVCQSFQEEE